MGTRRVYEIGNYAILQYYNLLGVDVRQTGIDVSGKTEVDELEELSPINSYELPKSSEFIDEKVQAFLYTACREFGYSEEEIQQKKEFIDSYWKIVNSSTNLNLTKNFDKPELHFERLNIILSYVLDSLNRLDIDEVITIGRFLSEGDYANLFGLAKEHSFIYFLLIAMSKDADLDDYTMFENDESATINYRKMFELLKKAMEKRKEGYEEFSSGMILRYPYSKCKSGKTS